MKHHTIGLSLAWAALTFLALAVEPASAQTQKPAKLDMKALPQAEVKAMSACVSGVVNRMRQEKATLRAVRQAVPQECDAPLRAVLAAAIRVGQAGPCTSVEGCIEQARTRAGNEAAVEFRRAEAGR